MLIVGCWKDVIMGWDGGAGVEFRVDMNETQTLRTSALASLLITGNFVQTFL